MISSIEIRNYKSIKHQILNFKKLNIIIGANNSGKSNLLNSIFTIQNIFRNPIEDVFGGGPFSFGAIFCKDSDYSEPMSFKIKGNIKSHPFEYDIELIGKYRGRLLFPQIKREFLSINDAQLTNTSSKDSFIYKSLQEKDIEDPKFFLRKNFKVHAYQFVPKLIKKDRQIEEYELDFEYGLIPFLKHDGSNLLDALYFIREHDMDRFSEIIKDCQKFFPNLKNIKITKGAGPTSVIQITMKSYKRDWKFIGPQLSDGFAIILSILTLLSSDKLPSIVLFEELENGLNPASIEILLNKMFEVSQKKGVQFLITTHSPVFLQLLRYNLDSIIICEQNKIGLSEYYSVRDKVKFFKEDYKEGESLIDLWLSGLIGGL